VFDPDKPVSLSFDACVAIDKGYRLCGRTACGCGGLGWERAHTSIEKYMCLRDNSWPCGDEAYHFCPYWICVSWATWHGAQHSVLFQKDTTTSNCSQGTCNPVNVTVLKPSDWTQGQIISIRIDGQGFRPGTLLHLKLITVTLKSSPYHVFYSFYEEMTDKFPNSVKTKNLFLTLAESIAQTLNVTSCYVCRGTNMGDHWPWESRELDPQVHFNESAFDNTGQASGSLKLPLLGITVSPAKEKNSPPQWGT
jgi:hypothetical protein